VLLDERPEPRGEPVGLVEVERVGVQHRARLRHDGDLDPRPEPRVEPDDRLLAGGRRQQELLQVPAEDGDGLRVRPVLQLEPELRLDGRGQEPLVGVLATRVSWLRAGRPDDPGHEPVHDLLLRRLHLPRQHPLRLAAPDRQHAVARDVGGLLGELEVVAEPGGRRVVLLAAQDPGRHHAARPRPVPDPAPERRVIGDALGQDVAGALEGVVAGLDPPGIFDVRPVDVVGRGPPAPASSSSPAQSSVGQRLEPLLPGDRRPGPTLRLVGEVEVLQLLLRGPAASILRLQVVVQPALLVDGLEDRPAPRLQLPRYAPGPGRPGAAPRPARRWPPSGTGR
jgi:hypothetical protein